MEMLVGVITLFLGYVAGLLTKGIHINITNKQPDPVPQDEIVYNESTVGELPDEIKQYYDQTRGFTNL